MFIITNIKEYLTQICRCGTLLLIIYLHINICISKSNGSLCLVTAIKCKAIRLLTVAMLLFQIRQKITLIKVVHFFRRYITTQNFTALY
jgi:hypothetical protein